MKKIFPITFLVILLFVIISPKTYACSCFDPGIEERFESSSVVFTGSAISKDADGGNIFKVDKAWKGELKNDYVYSGFFGMCGTVFELGKKYLVFTENYKGEERTSLCSGNKLIADASDDIKALNRLTEPVWKNKYVWISVIGFTTAIPIMIWRFRLLVKGGKD